MPRRRTWAGLAVLAVVWSALVGTTLIGARSDLERGREMSEEVAGISIGELLDGGAVETLRRASAEFGDGRASLGTPWLMPLGPVPVVGRQVRTAKLLSAAGERLTAAAADFAAVLESVGDPFDGADRLATIEALTSALPALRSAITAVDLGPGLGLFGSLHVARDQLSEHVAELRDASDKAAVALAGLHQLLSGPTDLIVVAAHNAEMRVGHGSLLSWGMLEAHAGDIEMPGGMAPIRTFPRPEAPPPLDPTLAPWGWIDLANVANLGVTPKWDVTARRILDLHQGATGQRADGVLLVDSVALAELIELLGRPVMHADGRGQVAADDALDYLLHDQYEGIPIEGLFAVNNARRDALADLGATVLAGLLDEVAVSDLLGVLSGLGPRRHVMAYSDDDVLQDGWRALGVSGETGAGSFGVAVYNAGQNKLDQFIETAVDVRSVDQADGSVEVEVELRLDNVTPPAEFPYVLGFRPPGTPPEGYAGLAVFSVPPEATSASVDGAGSYLVYDTQPGMGTTMSVPVSVARGAGTTVTARFAVQRGTVLQLIPGSRTPALRWAVEGTRVAPGSGTHRVQL